MKKLLLILFIVLTTSIAKAQNTDTIKIASDTAIYYSTEHPPEFPGGDKAFNAFIEKNIRYPRSGFFNHEHGKVFVQMIIEKDGSLSNIRVIRSLYKDLDTEAVRVVSTSPKWNPAIQNGKPVRFSYVLPITFKFGNTVIIMR